MIKLNDTIRMSSNFLIVLEGRLEMIFYDGGAAPNARRVRVFLSEKNIDIPIKPIDIMKGDHKKDDYKKISPLSQVPALELDDGTFITESIAICRYIEALNPEPNLFGKNPKDIHYFWYECRNVIFILLSVGNNVCELFDSLVTFLWIIISQVSTWNSPHHFYEKLIWDSVELNYRKL